MIGIDIVKIERIQLAAKRGVFLRRVFSAAEQKYYLESNERAECLAGMFAAKEAVIKTLGLKITEVKLYEIEILHQDSGKPFVNFIGDVRQYFSQYNVHISISHDGDYAVATAILQTKN